MESNLVKHRIKQLFNNKDNLDWGDEESNNPNLITKHYFIKLS